MKITGDPATCNLHSPTAQFSASALAPDRVPDRIFDKIVAGGGLAAIFTAYEILNQAKEAGKKISVLVIADRFNAPCAAGSQMIPMVEGLLSDDVQNRADINTLMRDSIAALQKTIEQENIDCRFARGYEIKAEQQDKLRYAVNNLIFYDIFKPEEMELNSGNQVFTLPGYNHSILIRSAAGQINMPELLNGLMSRITDMGGIIIEGTRYEGQGKEGNVIAIRTNRGDFRTSSPPLLATGAEHQKTLNEFKNAADNVMYTMGVVIGPLSDEDSAKLSHGPMAVTVVGPPTPGSFIKIPGCPREEANVALTGDFLWGGLDKKNYFTLGRGDTENFSDRDAIACDILTQIETLYPGLAEKYSEKISVSFGAMLLPENLMPIVGRMKDYDIAGGWAGMGIVAGYAAARAYAKHVVHGNNADLKIFESMHPDKFASPTPHEQFSVTHTQTTPAPAPIVHYV